MRNTQNTPQKHWVWNENITPESANIISPNGKEESQFAGGQQEDSAKPFDGGTRFG